MRLPFRILAGASLLAASVAQTWSKCNPLHQTQCPPDTALGRSISIDFTKGSVNSFEAQGVPAYDQTNGASFTIAASGDAPQLNSLFYIMFGRVEITMRAAPGAGIVSSVVLQSDDLDEIDLEWLGTRPDELQTNYFGKGDTTQYSRGQTHAIDGGTQNDWVTYTLDWTKDRILWSVAGHPVRELRQADAARQYPQTPMQLKFGAWAGGDPARNEPGVVNWAHGPTVFSGERFSMFVRSIHVTDYSTGTQYRYGDTSGSWESIIAVGGQVNGNAAGAGMGNDVMNLPFNSAFAVPNIPLGGMGRDGSPATKTQTGWPWVGTNPPNGGSIPSGWYMTPDGKIMRSRADSFLTDPPSLLLLSAISAFATFGSVILLGRCR